MIIVLRSEKFHRLRHEVAMKLNLLIGGGELPGWSPQYPAARPAPAFQRGRWPRKNRAVHQRVQALPYSEWSIRPGSPFPALSPPSSLREISPTARSEYGGRNSQPDKCHGVHSTLSMSGVVTTRPCVVSDGAR